MDDVSLLEIDKRFNNLSNYNSSLHLIKVSFSSQALKQITTLTVLKYSVNVLLIVKVAVEPHDVRVLQSPLNLEFFFHLSEKVKLFQCGFHNYFQRYSLLTVFFNRTENLAELSRADSLYAAEVIYGPCLFFLVRRSGQRIRFLHI